MPGIDGFEVVRRLRSEGTRAPVVFLTARDATEDKVTGLTVGGDDYVAKPFSLEEVLARIRAVLRRTTGAEAVTATPRLVFADIELDDETHEVWKANPLADWSDDDCWTYIRRRGLPYNALHDRGYASIGDTHSTIPGGGRDGRWAGTERTECGLHDPGSGAGRTGTSALSSGSVGPAPPA